MDELPIDRMRARAKQLRRIAGMTHNPEMTEMLLKMAGEVETDADRLDAELNVASGRH